MRIGLDGSTSLANRRSVATPSAMRRRRPRRWRPIPSIAESRRKLRFSHRTPESLGAKYCRSARPGASTIACGVLAASAATRTSRKAVFHSSPAAPGQTISTPSSPAFSITLSARLRPSRQTNSCFTVNAIRVRVRRTVVHRHPPGNTRGTLVTMLTGAPFDAGRHASCGRAFGARRIHCLPTAAVIDACMQPG